MCRGRDCAVVQGWHFQGGGVQEDTRLAIPELYLFELESRPEPRHVSFRCSRVGCRRLCEGREQLLHRHPRREQPLFRDSVSLLPIVYS